MTTEQLKAGYDWLLGFADHKAIELRIEKVKAEIQKALAKPDRVEYGSPPGDAVAQYLLLASSTIEAPTNLDYARASRVLPFITAIGANIDNLSKIENVDQRVHRWFLNGEKDNPDSGLFELLVGALYVRNGWITRFVPELPDKKTPDLSLSRSGKERWAECKRLKPRSEASLEEGKNWNRIWMPLSTKMWEERLGFVLDLVFHVPLGELPDTFLVDSLLGKLKVAPVGGTLVDNDKLTASSTPINFDRISAEMQENYVKSGTTREIQLITKDYRPTTRYAGGVRGKLGDLGDKGFGPALYWDKIEFAWGAYWSCDCPRVIERKARDIRARLAEAVRQLEGSTPSAAHIGIETLDGEIVEQERYSRILSTCSKFDASSTALDWIYCHLFGPESPPDKLWEFAETAMHSTRSKKPGPVTNPLLVVPELLSKEGAVHWNDS